MPTKTINGVELFYDDHGSGPPLLVHHGYTGSHYSWDPVVPLLGCALPRDPHGLPRRR